MAHMKKSSHKSMCSSKKEMMRKEMPAHKAKAPAKAKAKHKAMKK